MVDKDGKIVLDKNGEPTTQKVKKQLFDEKEKAKALGDELYQPLVREGLLAETFVPNDFSETREMIQGSFDAYKKRLEEEGVTNVVFRKENIAMASTLFSSMTTLIGGGGNIKSGLKVDPKDVGIKELAPKLSFFTEDLKGAKLSAVTDMMSLTFDGLRTKWDADNEIYDAVSSKLGKERAPALTKIATAMINLTGVGLSKALEHKDISNGVGVAISTFFNNRTNFSAVAVATINCLDEGQEDKLKQAGVQIGAGIDAALKEVGLRPKCACLRMSLGIGVAGRVLPKAARRSLRRTAQ